MWWHRIASPAAASRHDAVVAAAHGSRVVSRQLIGTLLRQIRDLPGVLWAVRSTVVSAGQCR
jgi:hypothetical protein